MTYTQTIKPSEIYNSGSATASIQALIDSGTVIKAFRPPLKGELFILAPMGREIMPCSTSKTGDNPRFIIEQPLNPPTFASVWE